MSWIEIGERLGISDTRVIQLHQRAIEKIREAVAKEPDLLEGFAELLGTTPDRTKLFIEQSRNVHYAPPVMSSASAERTPACYGRGQRGYERKPSTIW